MGGRPGAVGSLLPTPPASAALRGRGCGRGSSLPGEAGPLSSQTPGLSGGPLWASPGLARPRVCATASPPRLYTLPTWTRKARPRLYTRVHKDTGTQVHLHARPRFVLGGQACVCTCTRPHVHTQMVVHCCWISAHTHVCAAVRVPSRHPCEDVFACTATWPRVAEGMPLRWWVGAQALAGLPAGVPREAQPGPVAGPRLLSPGPVGRQPPATSAVCFPGGISVSQCSKEDGRSSSGPPHETAAPKRTYDMMEGRVSRAISSAGIEGGCRDLGVGGVGASQLGALERPLEGGRGRLARFSGEETWGWGWLRVGLEAVTAPPPAPESVRCQRPRHHLGDCFQVATGPT